MKYSFQKNQKNISNEWNVTKPKGSTQNKCPQEKSIPIISKEFKSCKTKKSEYKTLCYSNKMVPSTSVKTHKKKARMSVDHSSGSSMYANGYTFSSKDVSSQTISSDDQTNTPYKRYIKRLLFKQDKFKQKLQSKFEDNHSDKESSMNKSVKNKSSHTVCKAVSKHTSSLSRNVSVNNHNKTTKTSKHSLRKPIKTSIPSSPYVDFSHQSVAVLPCEERRSLRKRMMDKLQASRFRYMNEQMYCWNGDEALKYFKTDLQAFHAYHHGYRQQLKKWPLNPLHTIIKELQKKPSDLVVADFGCGDAQLAQALPNTVHSFDLVALSDNVTVCDMAHTPLKNSSVDVAVFCLSLMGVNLTDYLVEANRILKPGGMMKIAEIESRFDNVDWFIKSLHQYGFTITNKDLSHNLFHFMDFKKVKNLTKKSQFPQLTLKPCLYKKR